MDARKADRRLCIQKYKYFLLFSAFEQKNIIKEIIAKAQTICRGDLTSGLGFKRERPNEILF